jgi:hypothetical protein
MFPLHPLLCVTFVKVVVNISHFEMMKIPFKVTYAKVISSMCGETTQPNMAKRLDLMYGKNKISLELHFLVALEKHFLEVDYL